MVGRNRGLKKRSSKQSGERTHSSAMMMTGETFPSSIERLMQNPNLLD